MVPLRVENGRIFGIWSPAACCGAARTCVSGEPQGERMREVHSYRSVPRQRTQAHLCPDLSDEADDPPNRTPPWGRPCRDAAARSYQAADEDRVQSRCAADPVGQLL